jgi:hypothetical protein
MRFGTHYTRDEARALLPKVRKWLKRLAQLRADLQRYDDQITALMKPGCDLGGKVINEWVKALADLKSTLMEFERREIQIKDLERGLIDFPAIIDDKEVFLCWEQEEDDIDFWHDLDAGYGGREKLSGDEL